MANSEDQNNWVIIDNDTSDSVTILQVSNDRHETLFETLRILANFKLFVTKANVTCQDGWFMDVFHVVDKHGKKIQDEKLLIDLYKTIAAERHFIDFANDAVEVVTHHGYTVIQLRGFDRMGLLYELAKALRHHGCCIVDADMWTHKHHAAAVMCIADDITGVEIKDSKTLSRIKKALGQLIKPIKVKSICRIYEYNSTNEEFVDIPNIEGWSSRGHVKVSDCKERGYTLVEIRSDDRVKLLLNTVSALMVMQYVVYHGAVTLGKVAIHQEYYIRHINGRPISTIREHMHLKEFLEQTINSPDSEEVELEFSTDGQLMQWSEILTTFTSKGWWIRKAQICSVHGKAKHNYWITDKNGKAIDPGSIDSIQERIGEYMQLVKKKTGCSPLVLQRKTRGLFFDNPLRHIVAIIVNIFTSNHSAKPT